MPNSLATMTFEKAGNSDDSVTSTSGTPVAQVPGAHRPHPSQAATLMMNNMPANPVAPQQKTPVSNAAIIAASAPSSSNAELLSAFECPVCLEYMLPPYLQCNSGHLLCSNCRPKVASCPACRGPVPNIRNLAMEKIASQLMFPCKFNTSGCNGVFLHHQKVDHEERCDFRPYCCPCPGASCKWQGSLNDVMAHLMKSHKSITTLQGMEQLEGMIRLGEDIVFLATDINLPGAVDWVMMQSCFGSYFMLVLEKQDKQDTAGQSYQMFYAVVQLIGTKADAERFLYKLELSSGRRRLAWEATPRSIHEGVSTAITQSDCLAFDTNHATLFAEQGNLGINVTISQVQLDMSRMDPQMCQVQR